MKKQDNDIQASTRKQLTQLDEYRNELIDSKIKRNKEFAIAAGAVASMSAATVLGNILITNYQLVAQNSGTLLAMVSYSLGNYLMYKKATEEKTIMLSDPEEDINIINMLKNKLELLKTRLSYSKIQQATMATASAGFITSFISSLFMQPANIEATNTLAVIASAMAGAVGVAGAITAKKQQSMIKFYKGEIAETEAQLEQAEGKKEEQVEEQPVQKTLK